MKPITVNWTINLPNKSQIQKMWRELVFDIIDEEFEFINIVKANLGGNIYFKGFKFHENEIFDWFCSRGRLDEIDFYNNFLLSDKVLKTFNNENNSEKRAFKIDKEPNFDTKDGFVIDGELAALLFNGGAYGSKYKKEPNQIKEKARLFCSQLFREKYSYDYVRYYTSTNAWNTWFIDFIIDYTYLIVCMETRTIWILAFTDTD
ncbi:hypothetical protein [Cellulophaga omnivescoria]|uniref:hypothetical protein n=1 Tax=Cellulophaga omnivescoria TaxID=1888890 RepID=UPI0022F0C54C|nr:hypothetical protein [Cellulophaga omnivescoria]WBU90338.1 hypothetical protein PBN93_04820 [Cellulophaga omnivescoria]